MAGRFKWSDPLICTYKNNTEKPWFIYFDVTDTLSGITKRSQFRGLINRTKDKKERLTSANALISYWKKQLKAGWNPWDEDLPVTQPNVCEAFDLILQLKEASCSKRTLESYRYATKLLKDWLIKQRLDGMFINQLETHHARAFFDYLALKKNLGGRTYNDKITVLSTFANAMIEREWLQQSPFRKIKKVQMKVGRNIAFTEDEKQTLKAHLQQNDRPMYYFTQFIYYCFIRRSELTRLKIENIDWSNRTIVIPSHASKNKKQESVVIPESFWPVLLEMDLQNKPADWFIFGRKLQPCATQYKNYNHISTRHNTESKALCLSSEKGLYSWKHSGVCALYSALKGDVYALMRQLRHSDLNVTQIYLKSLGLLDNSAVRSAVW